MYNYGRNLLNKAGVNVAMCGFCGFTGDVSDKTTTINEMMEKIVHRGPDSSGHHVDEHIALGFRRLSFIDLSEGGEQPMFNEDKSIAIVFNGEIYNYKTLREELLGKGHIFHSSSDTEVLLHLYEECGKEMFSKLRGMFAFLIYDKNKGELFAARDFFGIKPFYYSVFDGKLLFGSEIKSFLAHPNFKKEVNVEALEHYLTFQYSVLQETFFKGVYKLPPGHYMTFKDGKVEVTRYFEATFSPKHIDLSHSVTAIDNAVKDSVAKHKISDVPIGSFLSSGVDSSYIAACLEDAKTFTVGFDYDDYNEIEYAKELSAVKGLESHSKMISTDEYWDSLKKVQYHMDEPLADPAAVALYFVSQLASKHVKGAMSGEGADEFFGGYNIYKEPLDLKLVTSLPMFIRRFLGKFAEMLPFKVKGKNFFIRASKTVEERFIGNANIFSKRERETILKSANGKRSAQDITKPVYDRVKNYDDITKMQYADINLWLQGDILLKADKMSMAHSLEVRVPFLDKEVFKVASKLPTDFRVNKTATKYAFRLAAKEHLPESVAAKKKLGFPVPIRIWLKEDKYYNKVKEAFTSKAAEQFFKSDELVKLLDVHRNGKADNSRKIWTVYMFLVWYGEFFAA